MMLQESSYYAYWLGPKEWASDAASNSLTQRFRMHAKKLRRGQQRRSSSQSLTQIQPCGLSFGCEGGSIQQGMHVCK